TRVRLSWKTSADTGLKKEPATKRHKRHKYFCDSCAFLWLILHACGLQCREHPRVPERNPPQTHARRIEDCVPNSGDGRLARRLTRAILRKIRPVRIRITIHQHHIDLRRRIEMRE